MGPFPSSPGFFKRVVPTHPAGGGGAGPTETVAQAWPALPVLVKARVCARGARKAEAGTALDPREGPALVRPPLFPASPRGSARAQSVPRGGGANLSIAPRPRARPSSQSPRWARRGGARQGAFPRGQPRPLSALSYPPSFPRGSCTEVVAGASPIPRLASPAGAMAAFSKYLTARNSSLAGAAFLLLCLLHKRRRALGLHG